MPCTLSKGQDVRNIGTGEAHIITDMRKTPPRQIVGGWGSDVVEYTHIQVDGQTNNDGHPVWQASGDFEEI
ncbi:MAG: hypothetical protein HOE19_03150 [Candidatus Komeilibacteria bacterium]|jgi:hypothetical protein|nr:hypothetical protein [Candidatus Komeilibacteria bacterium]MBT4447674.1 hypothetical protein [Candidatus Komeilibacteria bacterium]